MKVLVAILVVAVGANCYAAEEEVQVQQQELQAQGVGSVRGGGFCGLGGCFGGRGGGRPSGGSGGRGNQAFLERAPGFPSGSGSGSGGRQRFPGFRRSRRDLTDGQTQEMQQQAPTQPQIGVRGGFCGLGGCFKGGSRPSGSLPRPKPIGGGRPSLLGASNNYGTGGRRRF